MTQTKFDPAASVNKDTLVMFLHGLEGGTTGDKSRYFKKHYGSTGNVLVPEMRMSMWDIRKKNSFPRTLIAKTNFVTYLAVYLAAMCYFFFFHGEYIWEYYCALPIFAAWMLILFVGPSSLRQAGCESLEGCADDAIA